MLVAYDNKLFSASDYPTKVVSNTSFLNGLKTLISTDEVNQEKCPQCNSDNIPFCSFCDEYGKKQIVTVEVRKLTQEVINEKEAVEKTFNEVFDKDDIDKKIDYFEKTPLDSYGKLSFFLEKCNSEYVKTQDSLKEKESSRGFLGTVSNLLSGSSKENQLLKAIKKREKETRENERFKEFSTDMATITMGIYERKCPWDVDKPLSHMWCERNNSKITKGILTELFEDGEIPNTVVFAKVSRAFVDMSPSRFYAPGFFKLPFPLPEFGLGKTVFRNVESNMDSGVWTASKSDQHFVFRISNKSHFCPNQLIRAYKIVGKMDNTLAFSVCGYIEDDCNGITDVVLPGALIAGFLKPPNNAIGFKSEKTTLDDLTNVPGKDKIKVQTSTSPENGFGLYVDVKRSKQKTKFQLELNVSIPGTKDEFNAGLNTGVSTRVFFASLEELKEQFENFNLDTVVDDTKTENSFRFNQEQALLRADKFFWAEPLTKVDITPGRAKRAECLNLVEKAKIVVKSWNKINDKLFLMNPEDFKQLGKGYRDDSRNLLVWGSWGYFYQTHTKRPDSTTPVAFASFVKRNPIQIVSAASQLKALAPAPAAEEKSDEEKAPAPAAVPDAEESSDEEYKSAAEESEEEEAAEASDEGESAAEESDKAGKGPAPVVPPSPASFVPPPAENGGKGSAPAPAAAPPAENGGTSPATREIVPYIFGKSSTPEKQLTNAAAIPYQDLVRLFENPKVNVHVVKLLHQLENSKKTKNEKELKLLESASREASLAILSNALAQGPSKKGAVPDLAQKVVYVDHSADDQIKLIPNTMDALELCSLTDRVRGEIFRGDFKEGTLTWTGVTLSFSFSRGTDETPIASGNDVIEIMAEQTSVLEDSLDEQYTADLLASFTQEQLYKKDRHRFWQYVTSVARRRKTLPMVYSEKLGMTVLRGITGSRKASLSGLDVKGAIEAIKQYYETRTGDVPTNRQVVYPDLGFILKKMLFNDREISIIEKATGKKMDTRIDQPKFLANLIDEKSVHSWSYLLYHPFSIPSDTESGLVKVEVYYNAVITSANKKNKKYVRCHHSCLKDAPNIHAWHTSDSGPLFVPNFLQNDPAHRTFESMQNMRTEIYDFYTKGAQEITVTMLQNGSWVVSREELDKASNIVYFEDGSN